jgi:hypothetical protein
VALGDPCGGAWACRPQNVRDTTRDMRHAHHSMPRVAHDTIRDTIHDTQPTRNETAHTQRHDTKRSIEAHSSIPRPPPPRPPRRSHARLAARWSGRIGTLAFSVTTSSSKSQTSASPRPRSCSRVVRRCDLGRRRSDHRDLRGMTQQRAPRCRADCGSARTRLISPSSRSRAYSSRMSRWVIRRGVGVSISMVRLFKRGVLAVRSSAQLTTQHVRPSSLASCLSLWLMRSRRGFSRQRARCSSGTRRGSFEEEVRTTADGGHERGRERQTEARGRAAVRAGHGGVRCLRTTRSSGCSVWSFTRTFCRGLDWRCLKPRTSIYLPGFRWV